MTERELLAHAIRRYQRELRRTAEHYRSNGLEWAADRLDHDRRQLALTLAKVDRGELV